AVAALAGKPVLAFAGIADPGKFFATLEAHGIAVAVRSPFPDHHRYTAYEISGLVTCAQRNDLTLVTTEKDMARLSGDPGAVDLTAQLQVLPVILKFRDVPAVEAMLHTVIHGPTASGSRFRSILSTPSSRAGVTPRMRHLLFPPPPSPPCRGWTPVYAAGDGARWPGARAPGYLG